MSYCGLVHFETSVDRTRVRYYQARRRLESQAAENEERDRLQPALLQDAGWLVCRFWAHEHPEQIAMKVDAELSRLRRYSI